jgi:hypothetical protein
MNRINSTLKRLSEPIGDLDPESVEVPQKLAHQIETLNCDWAEVHRLANQLRPHDDEQVNEVMAQGKDGREF